MFLYCFQNKCITLYFAVVTSHILEDFSRKMGEGGVVRSERSHFKRFQ